MGGQHLDRQPQTIVAGERTRTSRRLPRSEPGHLRRAAAPRVLRQHGRQQRRVEPRLPADSSYRRAAQQEQASDENSAACGRLVCTRSRAPLERVVSVKIGAGADGLRRRPGQVRGAVHRRARAAAAFNRFSD